MNQCRIDYLGIAIACFLLIILLLFTGCVTPQPWTIRNKVMAGVLITGTAADMVSTSYALSNGARELNPLLGEHPNDATLALFGLASTGVILLVSHYLLTPTQRDWLLGIVGVVHFGAAGSNYIQTRNHLAIPF